MRVALILTVAIVLLCSTAAQPVEERGAACDINSPVMKDCSLNIGAGGLILRQPTSFINVDIVCTPKKVCITADRPITMTNVQATSAGKKGGAFLLLRKGADLMADGLTVTGFKCWGKKWENGCAIHANVWGNNIILKRCTFKDNAATQWGGALYLTGVTLAMSDCTFDTNAAPYGGGAIAIQQSIASISKTTFTGCHTSWTGDRLPWKHAGGAIYMRETDLTMTGSSFVHNFATWEGAAMVMYYSKLTFSDNTFEDNEAEAVAGLALNDIHGVLADNTFKANVGHEYGGAIGIWYEDSALTINRNTFTDNQAPAGFAPDFYCEAGEWEAAKNFVNLSPALPESSIWDEGGNCDLNMN